MHRKKAAKAREMSFIYKEEADQLETQANELERTLRPIYPQGRREDRSRSYERRDERARGFDRRDDW